MRTFVLLLVLASVALAGSITETTPLFDTWGGNSNCNTYGSLNSCSFNNWWSNGSSTTTKWSDTGSYDSTTWVNAGKSVTDTYNWGNSWGSSFNTEDQGAGWSNSDYYNQSLSNWTGQYMDTNGNGNQWGGSDNQLNHSIWNNVYAWSCNGANCKQENWWWMSNEYNYSASGWWMSTLYGEYQNSDNWKNAFSSLTGDHGYDTYSYNRYGTPSTNDASQTPEPGTWVMMVSGAGLIILGRKRPIPVRVRNMLSPFHKTWGKKR